MLGDNGIAKDIYIACDYTDIRKSIDGLTTRVQKQFQLDSFSSILLCNRRCAKSKYCTFLLRKTFVALAGVSHYKSLEPIFAQLRRNGTENIVEAYDMDKYTNPHVEQSCMQMIQIANEYGFQVHRLRWDERYKGIDDWLQHRRQR